MAAASPVRWNVPGVGIPQCHGQIAQSLPQKRIPLALRQRCPTRVARAASDAQHSTGMHGQCMPRAGPLQPSHPATVSHASAVSHASTPPAPGSSVGGVGSAWGEQYAPQAPQAPAAPAAPSTSSCEDLSHKPYTLHSRRRKLSLHSPAPGRHGSRSASRSRNYSPSSTFPRALQSAAWRSSSVNSSSSNSSSRRPGVSFQEDRGAIQAGGHQPLLSPAAQSLVRKVVQEMSQGGSVVACGLAPSPTRAVTCLSAAIQRVLLQPPPAELAAASPMYAPGPAAPPRVLAILVCPTHQLAAQAHELALELLSVAGCRAHVQLMHGGAPIKDDLLALRTSCPALLVATPGRLMHLVSQGAQVRLEHLLGGVRLVVLDGAEELLALPAVRHQVDGALRGLSAMAGGSRARVAPRASPSRPSGRQLLVTAAAPDLGPSSCTQQQQQQQQQEAGCERLRLLGWTEELDGPAQLLLHVADAARAFTGGAAPPAVVPLVPPVPAVPEGGTGRAGWVAAGARDGALQQGVHMPLQQQQQQQQQQQLFLATSAAAQQHLPAAARSVPGAAAAAPLIEAPEAPRELDTPASSPALPLVANRTRDASTQPQHSPPSPTSPHPYTQLQATLPSPPLPIAPQPSLLPMRYMCAPTEALPSYVLAMLLVHAQQAGPSSRSLVLCPTAAAAAAWAAAARRLGLPALELHSLRSAQYRSEALQVFKLQTHMATAVRQAHSTWAEDVAHAQALGRTQPGAPQPQKQLQTQQDAQQPQHLGGRGSAALRGGLVLFSAGGLTQGVDLPGLGLVLQVGLPRSPQHVKEVMYHMHSRLHHSAQLHATAAAILHRSAGGGGSSSSSGGGGGSSNNYSPRHSSATSLDGPDAGCVSSREDVCDSPQDTGSFSPIRDEGGGGGGGGGGRGLQGQGGPPACPLSVLLVSDWEERYLQCILQQQQKGHVQVRHGGHDGPLQHHHHHQQQQQQEQHRRLQPQRQPQQQPLVRTDGDGGSVAASRLGAALAHLMAQHHSWAPAPALDPALVAQVHRAHSRAMGRVPRRVRAHAFTSILVHYHQHPLVAFSPEAWRHMGLQVCKALDLSVPPPLPHALAQEWGSEWLGPVFRAAPPPPPPPGPAEAAAARERQRLHRHWQLMKAAKRQRRQRRAAAAAAAAVAAAATAATAAAERGGDS